jgi:hypothetical protein
MFVYYSYDPERGLDYVRALTAIRWRRLGDWIGGASMPTKFNFTSSGCGVLLLWSRER